MSSRASTSVRSWPVMVALEEEELEHSSLRRTAAGSMALMSSALESMMSRLHALGARPPWELVAVKKMALVGGGGGAEGRGEGG